jgi:ribosomal protein S18 acetylase RimI-like enzyme
MKIRLLNAKDAGIYRTIRLEAVQDAPLAFAESAAEARGKSFDDFVNYLDSHERGDFVLGAFEDDTLIGVVGFFRTAHGKHSHKGTIWGMYVRPAYRRRGVGAALIAAAIERARNIAGVRQMNLSVTASNTAAKRLYENAGFRVYGVEPGALSMEGKYFDEDLMQLVL